jgi:hypothetical protein
MWLFSFHPQTSDVGETHNLPSATVPSDESYICGISDYHGGEYEND